MGTKQTPVEWFEDTLKNMVYNGADFGDDYDSLLIHIKRAKQMEMEQSKTFNEEEMEFIKRCIKVYWEYHSNRVHPDNQKDWVISQNILKNDE
jgi:hypothetical protein